MRRFVKADLTIQLVLIAALVIACLVYGVEKAGAIWMLLILWQITSGTISVIKTQGRDQFRWAFMLCWLCGSVVMSSANLLMMIIPACLTLFYLIVTIRSIVKYRGHKGSFLRHISF